MRDDESRRCESKRAGRAGGFESGVFDRRKSGNNDEEREKC
jgi:hypothetical protein